ncbi:MAG: tetratricopeptide repeat protein [Candidatus Babeliales bacterium]
MQKKHSVIITYVMTPFLLALATIIAYFPSLTYDFQFDDINNISKFFDIRHWGFKELFFKDSRWIGTWLNTINYQLSAFNPYSYRVLNVAIHVAAAVCIFFVVFSLLSYIHKKHFARTYAYAISLVTTILFLLHPVQTQTVSYIIQGRLEGLASLFAMGVILAMIKWVAAPTTAQKIVYGLLGMALLVLGCGTKEIFIVTPFLLLLVDWFFISQGSWHVFKRNWPIHMMAFSIVGGVYFYFKREFIWQVITFSNLAHNNIGNTITNYTAQDITPWYYLMTQFKVILHYMWIFIWPFALSVEYDWTLVHGFFDPNCFFPFLVLCGLLGIVIALLRKDSKNIYAFGILWFLICVLPRSSIIPSAELVVDYKTYLASVGMFLIFALGITHLSLWAVKKMGMIKKGAFVMPHAMAGHMAVDRMGMYSTIAGYTILIAFLGSMSYRRNMVWESGLTFWKNITDHAPNKARAHNNYAVELLKQLRAREAVTALRKAIIIEPGYWDAFNNLGIAYNYLGNVDLAIGATLQAIKVNPQHVEAYNNLGKYYIQAQEFERAHMAFLTAISLRPYYGKAYFNQGNLYSLQNNIEKAYECFKICCTQADFDTVPYGFSAWGRMAFMLNKLDEAREAFKKTLSLDPRYKEALLGLGNIYHMEKDFIQAREYYKKLSEWYSDDAAGWCNMAETYFAQNDVKTAMDYLMIARKCDNCPPRVDVTIAEYMAQKGEYMMARQLAHNVLRNQEAPDELKVRAREIIRGIA